MALAKLPFFRYLLIDQMLRSKQKPFPTKTELLEACQEKFGVRSASTIEKDLNAMRLDFDAPIKFDKRQKGYYYEDPGFKFMSVNLSDENLLALGFVETILQEFRDMPIFSEFSDAVDKVLDGLEITRRFPESNAKKMGRFVQIDKSPYFKGSEMLSQLIGTVTARQPIRLGYHKFGADEPKEYLLHPYLIKEYRDLWYVVGYVEKYREVRMFGIDRVVSVEPDAKEPYISQEEVDFDAEHFFAHCIGVTALDGKPERVELSFHPMQGNYVKSNPLHRSQTILADTPEELRIGLEIVVNIELKRVILSYGADVRVLAPASLAAQIGATLQEASGKYSA